MKRPVTDYETKKKMVCINSFAIAGNKAYLSNGNFNALIIYNLDKGEIEHMEKFAAIDESVFAYHKGCIEYEGTVFFCPDGGNVLHSYDTVEKKQRYFELPSNKNGVQYAYAYKHDLVLFPYYGEEGLIVVDMNDPEKNYVADWWKNHSALEARSLLSGVYKEGMVWSCCLGTNKLLITDYVHHTVKEYNVNIKGKKVWQMEFDGKNFWVTVTEDGSIYEWSIEKGILNVYEMRAEEKEPFKPYKIFHCADDKVFIFMTGKNEIYVLNTVSGKLDTLSVFPGGEVYPACDWTVYRQRSGNILYLFCYFTSFIIRIDLRTLEVSYISSIVRNSEIYDKYTDKIMKDALHGGVLKEDRGYNWQTELPVFLSLIHEYGSDLAGCSTVNTGGKIYRQTGYGARYSHLDPVVRE